MNNEPPYPNIPSGPPSGYPSYPEQSSMGYGQSGTGYGPPPVYPPPSGYAQPGYSAAGYAQPGYPPPAGYASPDPRKGLAITGFILGLLSLILWVIPFVGGFLDLLMAILGIVLSSLGLKSTTSRGLAVAGLVLSIISLAIAGIVIILLIAFLSAAMSHPYSY